MANQCETYKVSVYMGLQEGYDGTQHHWKEAVRWIRTYVDEVGLGVTVTPTEFVYTDGNESGVIVGLIQYPRFPKPQSEIDEHAVKIAKLLMEAFSQERCTIETPTVSYLLEREENVDTETDG